MVKGMRFVGHKVDTGGSIWVLGGRLADDL